MTQPNSAKAYFNVWHIPWQCLLQIVQMTTASFRSVKETLYYLQHNQTLIYIVLFLLLELSKTSKYRSRDHLFLSCQCTFDFAPSLEIGLTAFHRKSWLFHTSFTTHSYIIIYTCYYNVTVWSRRSAHSIRIWDWQLMGQWFQPCILCFLFTFFHFCFILSLFISF